MFPCISLKYLKNSACTFTPIYPLYISSMPSSWSVWGRLKEWAVVLALILKVMEMVDIMVMFQASQLGMTGIVKLTADSVLDNLRMSTAQFFYNNNNDDMKSFKYKIVFVAC